MNSNTLRKYSNIISVISLAVPILSGIAGLIAVIQSGSFLIFLSCALSSALFYIFVQSYARMLNTTADNEEALAEMSASLKKLNTQFMSEQKIVQTSSNTSEITTSETSDDDSSQPGVSPIIDPRNPYIITCPNCHVRQSANRQTCFQCGTKFEK